MRKNISALFIVFILALFIPACLIPDKIERQASWAIIQDPQWKLYWKESIRTQEQRTIGRKTVDIDVTSRATAWFNESQQTALLIVSTPSINLYGVTLNPLQKESDEWVLREIAKQGRGVAETQLGFSLDPAAVQLSSQASISAPTPWNTLGAGTRFWADTPKEDAYVSLLRITHEQNQSQRDVIILAMVTQSNQAIQGDTSIARHLTHPAAEPEIYATIISKKGIEFIKELEGLHPGPVEQPYNDSRGNCTIGYGHLIHYGPCNGQPDEVYFRNYIKQFGVEALFQEDLEKRAMRYVREYVTVSLSQNQFDALISYTFNRGGGNLRLLVEQSQLNQGVYQQVHIRMLTAEHIPSAIPELEGRRCDEAELFKNGDYAVQRRNPCPLKR